MSSKAKAAPAVNIYTNFPHDKTFNLEIACTFGVTVALVLEVLKERGAYHGIGGSGWRVIGDREWIMFLPFLPLDDILEAVEALVEAGIVDVSFNFWNIEIDDYIESGVEISYLIDDEHVLPVEVPKRSTHGFVYLMHFEGRYKVGWSGNLERRCAELSTKFPHKVELLASIYSDDAQQLETYIHHAFRQNRIKGEWFALPDEEVADFYCIATHWHKPPSKKIKKYIAIEKEKHGPVFTERGVRSVWIEKSEDGKNIITYTTEHWWEREGS